MVFLIWNVKTFYSLCKLFVCIEKMWPENVNFKNNIFSIYTPKQSSLDGREVDYDWETPGSNLCSGSIARRQIQGIYP